MYMPEHIRNHIYLQLKLQIIMYFLVENETDGCAKETLELCDHIVELPMFGINTSLNVMVTLGIVLYKTIEKTPKK